MKITIDNMSEFDLQPIFHQAVRHLLQQNKRSCKRINSIQVGTCRYLDDDKLKCAFGVFIPDEKYNFEMEGMGSGYVLEEFFPEAQLTFSIRFLLSRLQLLHDTVHPANWERALKKLAEDFNLTYYGELYEHKS